MKSRPILFSAPMVRAILEGRKSQTRRICKVQPPADALWGSNGVEWMWLDDRDDTADRRTLCPFGVVGDRLYVRETFRVASWSVDDGRACIAYEADGVERKVVVDEDDHGLWCDRQAARWKRAGAVLMKYDDDGDTVEADDTDDGDDCWYELPQGKRVPATPSIHMPRWASRITLEVTGVRVERLAAISAADAIAEGIAPISCSALWWNYLDKGRALTRPESSFRSLWESINGAGSWDANPWTWVVEFKVVTP